MLSSCFLPSKRSKIDAMQCHLLYNYLDADMSADRGKGRCR